MEHAIPYAKSLEPSTGSERTPTRKIAEFLKDTVSGVTAEEMSSMMEAHYAKLRLIDKHGEWALPCLADISDFLLPGNLDKAASSQFIDEMARAADENAYLKDFLAKAHEETFAAYMAKVEEEGDSVLPDVVAYAHALDRLTIAMRRDWNILDACKNHWIGARKVARTAKIMGLFEHAKLASVEWPMAKFVENHRAGQVAPDFMKYILPANIMEAVFADWAEGMFANGYAGVILAKYAPGKKDPNPKTGEGPTCFSDDGHAIWLNMALPRQWTDLYATWNLAFVTGYENPYMMPKLLIPSVNNYKDAPAEYIYNRGMALYTHIHFMAFRRVDFLNAGQEEIAWPDKHLRKFWGTANKRYARQYDSEVKAQKVRVV